MTSNSSITTAKTLIVHAENDVTYAYRILGASKGEVPLVLLQHFRGNLDNWDPALVDALAREREVIVFNNTGVASSTGTIPDTVETMSDDAAAFLTALGLAKVDLFGFSLGGFIAQHLALTKPEIVRRLILAGTGPKGGPGMAHWSEDVVSHLVTPDAPGAEDILAVFYAPTGESQMAGGAALGRIFTRSEGRDIDVSTGTKDSQYYGAVLSWGRPDWDAVQALTRIQQPTLILQGDNDVMIPTAASHLMAGLIPGARIRIFPNASHGSIFQYAPEAAAETLSFLAS
ncbi:pimeloyl-ACP methyl ester carboxylesterase [Pseudarthrobacter sp. W1I19]|uniref:alpha/beta fold hydrolase n=1 Tax=Pseudarthrobacter sp. W1I19 TaxID=3042288 RepID=UPI0027851D40|nr:alpha/beta hydrolase [Pseudarthrobacter sp. W1I19]MDQ0921509.1 pimeloyl-ACP methyl ester carboxylesterase [Pseudarthrobacter sp. W1I19]